MVENPKIYPKLVYPNGPAGDYVKVFNFEEEKAAMGLKKEEEKPKDQGEAKVQNPNGSKPATGW